MGKLWATVKLGTKLTAVGGVLYISDQYRLWGSHEEATKGFKQLKTDIVENKYVMQIPNVEIPKEVSDLIPKEIPIPETQNLCSTARKYWNTGVLWVFKGLADLPATAKSQSFVLSDYISRQLEATTQPPVKETTGKQPSSGGS